MRLVFVTLLASGAALAQTALPPITNGARFKWAVISTVGPANLAGGLVSSGWGTADAGGAWSVSAAARTKVEGSEGVVYGMAGNQDVQTWHQDPRANMEILALVRLGQTNPTGANYQVRVVARAQADARNGYGARITHTTTGAARWVLSRTDNGGGTGSLSLANGTLADAGAAGTSW